MRFAVGGVSHETSSFTPIGTDVTAFENHFLLRGDQLIETFDGTNTPIGGFLAAARAGGDDVVPTLFAEAHPSGPATRAAFEAIVGELVERIAAATPVDAVVLDLHGAMVAEHSVDCERDILTALRGVLGDGVPIVAQLDIHSNTSPETVALADMLVGRRSYPELDMGIRGEECVALARRMAAGEITPCTAFRQLPFVWGINQATQHEPMASAVRELEAVLALPQVLTASIANGYPYADVPCMGASVWVVTDADPAFADALTDRLWEWIVARRELWSAALPTTAEALAGVGPETSFPVILADRFDNTGAGTPGDSTGMLRAFVDAGVEQACLLYVVDPESVAACHAAGAGASLRLAIGGRSSADQGPPVELDVTVDAVSDGAFVYRGPMYANLAGSMGPSACVRHGGLAIVLVSDRSQPLDTAFSHTLGLRPEDLRFIGVKSQAHFRSGFEAWAGEIHVVREPSVHNPIAGGLHYTRARPDVLENLGRA